MKPLGRNSLRPLPKSFFCHPTLWIARNLLGKGILRIVGEDKILVRIIETEAYLSKNDPASHSFRGPNGRNRSMFGPAGTCYVYLSYGMHYCMNVVTGAKGVGEAVLLRAALPVFGERAIVRNRPGVRTKDWMSGPGKLTKALEVDRRFDGLFFGDHGLFLVDLGRPCGRVAATPRIGISKATNLPYRFVTEVRT